MSIWNCFLTSSSFTFLILNFSPFKLLCYLFNYCQTFPNFCNHQIVIRLTVDSLETSSIWYKQMPSPIYPYAISPLVILPNGRGPGVLMNVSVREHHALNLDFLMCKFNILTPVSLITCWRLSFPIFGLKTISLPTFVFKIS